MRYARSVALGLATLLPSVASGVVITVLNDPHKERGVAAAQGDPKVKALRLEFDALAGRMQSWKACDFEALFGPPARVVHADYALTCTQSRLVCMSGIGLVGGGGEQGAHGGAPRRRRAPRGCASSGTG